MPSLDRSPEPVGSAASSIPSPSSALGRRFVDILLKEAGRTPSEGSGSRGATPEIDELSEFGFIPGHEESIDVDQVGLPLNLAAAAVLLASAFEADPSVLRSLRSDAPAIVVHLPSEGLHDATRHVLSVCAFGRATRIVEEGSLVAHSSLSRSERRAAVILSCDVGRTGRSRLDEWALTALSLGVPVVAISTDPQHAVPVRFRSTADRVLQFGRWNASMLALLIEAVTGVQVDVADEPWIAGLSIDDLRSSISDRRGAAGSLERLKTMVERRSTLSEELPRLADLSGYDRAGTIGLAMIEDLDAYGAGRIGWRDVERGMLLAGPPGVGKSFFARVFARSAGLPLVSASLAQWQSCGHLGDCLAAMKRSFSEAKNAAPAVLFIDELDSIGDRATFDLRNRDYCTQVVNALLEQLDGAADREGVVVLGATNHADRIDPAIIRPGRFDRVVHIPLPKPKEMVGILRTCLGDDLSEVDLMPVALAGCGGSGADAAAWVRRARGSARHAGRKIRFDDMLEAVRDGRPPVSEAQRRRAAVHEAGHACAAAALGIGQVDSLTLHDGGGTTLVRTKHEATTAERAVRDLVHVLAGRAAEIVFLGAPSAGSGGSSTSDLAIATRIALAFEVSWGLGQAGPIWFADQADPGRMMAQFAGSIPPVRRLLLQAEAQAEKLVASNRDVVDRLAARLSEIGHLDEEEIAPLIADVARFEILAPDPA